MTLSEAEIDRLKAAGAETVTLRQMPDIDTRVFALRVEMPDGRMASRAVTDEESKAAQIAAIEAWCRR